MSIYTYLSCITFVLNLATSGLYYKPMKIVYDYARIVNKLDASLTDDARVVIYDCHMFIVQAIETCYNT
jgi:hypothetical protein